MARILCLCPSHRDRRELPRHVNGHAVVFHEYASLELEQITVPGETREIRIGDTERELGIILERCARERIDAVLSTDDYPGAALASAVAHERGLAGPAPASSLVAQHKYLCREVQARAAPDCVPPFGLIDVVDVARFDARFPVFVKPVKSFFSVGAARVDRSSQLDAHRRRWRALPDFFHPLDVLLRRYAGQSIGTRRLLAEGLLEGAQATLECYVHAGAVQPLGVVDSVFFPGTLAFQRFEYPSALAPAVQERMLDAAGKVLRALGYDHGLANVEFIYDERADALGIVEINPRMSSQFADLFEKVDGTNSYEVLVDLALGRAPRVKRRRGAHRMAASCVMRRFEDGIVRKLPTEEDVRGLGAPSDVRVEILAEAGMPLSAQMQDECSYRFAVINLGGRDRGELLSSFERMRARLPFAFERR